jgi:hypothetical protein
MLPGEFGWAVLLQSGQAEVSSKGQTDSCLLSWYLNAPEEEVQTVWRLAFRIWGLAAGWGYHPHEAERKLSPTDCRSKAPSAERRTPSGRLAPLLAVSFLKWKLFI